MTLVTKVFELRPYLGAGSIEFGMGRDQVARELGPPASVSKTRRGDVEEYREGIKVYYSKSLERLREIVLTRPSTALYHSVDLLRADDPLDVLSEDDPHPSEYAGTILFLDLGIAVTGFAEEDDPDSAVGMFERGLWDDLKDRLRPWRHPGG